MTSREEHAAVQHNRSRKALARHGHPANGINGLDFGVVHINGVQSGLAIGTARDHHSPIAQAHGGVLLPRRGHLGG